VLGKAWTVAGRQLAGRGLDEPAAAIPTPALSAAAKTKLSRSGTPEG
jgi:hypothetical protein